MQFAVFFVMFWAAVGCFCRRSSYEIASICMAVECSKFAAHVMFGVCMVRCMWHVIRIKIFCMAIEYSGLAARDVSGDAWCM